MDRRLAEGVLYTDQYQLTMAQLYHEVGLAERPARFEHIFRRYPDYGRHQAGYCVNAGAAWLADWIRDVRFDDTSLDQLRNHRNHNGESLFGEEFLRWLADVGDFSALRIEAIPEGRVVHPNVPLTVVEGPLALAQLLETSLLNHLNFQTLIATKASRVVEAAAGGSVLEFGMRRAPERGASAASRASLIGGAVGSSNVGLSHAVGHTPVGTHAHSLVQVFMTLGEGELGAFRAYADLYPDECLLLVDTIDTITSGVPNAITVFKELQSKGHQPIGIRLDSGDLAHLAVRASAMLDDAGFEDLTIVLSSSLDELTIWQILNQITMEAPQYDQDPRRVIGRLAYGCGTRMVTSEGAPSLDGVYKLVALEDGGSWQPAMKLSDTPAKVINPGRKRVWRIYGARGPATADLLAQTDEVLGDPLVLHHPATPGVTRTLNADQISSREELLERFDPWTPVDDKAAIEAARQRRVDDLSRLHVGVRRIVNPHVYHVSLSEGSWRLKNKVMAKLDGR
jgi:nicotinate phosphoribosyltransferase